MKDTEGLIYPPSDFILRQAVIFKNNKPKYMLVDLDVSPMIDMTDDEKIDVVAARILKKYKPAFMELAK